MPKTVKFLTQTGNIYDIDYEAKTWSASSKNTMTSSGTFKEVDPSPIVGLPFEIWADTIAQGFSFHRIQTSPVVEILESVGFEK